MKGCVGVAFVCSIVLQSICTHTGINLGFNPKTLNPLPLSLNPKPYIVVMCRWDVGIEVAYEELRGGSPFYFSNGPQCGSVAGMEGAVPAARVQLLVRNASEVLPTFEFGQFQYWVVNQTANWQNAEVGCVSTYSGHLVPNSLTLNPKP